MNPYTRSSPGTIGRVLPGLAAALLLALPACKVTTVPIPFFSLDFGEEPEIVIGQPDAQSSAPNQGGSTPGASTLAFPTGNPVLHGNGVLYIADTGVNFADAQNRDNNRVLGFDSGLPSTDEPVANFVLGQDGMEDSGFHPVAGNRFFNPGSLAAYNDYLALADVNHHRILLWEIAPTGGGNPQADIAVGQPDLETADAPACLNNRLRNPQSVFLVDDKLVVADTGNHRILIWNSIPGTHNAPADIVIGQQNFENCLANRGNTDPAANTLNNPSDVWSDGTHLLIADSGNHRILIWNDFPASNGVSANVVLGQTSMFEATSGASRFKLNTPRFIASDGNHLFVADTGNSRVVMRDGIPTSNGRAFGGVLGQPNLFTGTTPTTANATNIHTPSGLLWNGTDLLVADSGFHRVLIFEDQ